MAVVVVVMVVMVVVIDPSGHVHYFMCRSWII